MANYGIPYMGSKDAVINRIATLFPKADNFYDLFGGGFAVSHYMILHRAQDYKRLFYNEVKADIAELIKDAIAGKYNYSVFKPKWISREEFLYKKDTCAYTRLIWSFGNNQKTYLFGEDIEPIKRSLHNAVVFGEIDQRAFSMLRIKKFPENLSIRGRRLLTQNIVKTRCGELQQLERLEQLERIQRLERLDKIQISALSYDQVKIEPNSVIYCDPPYLGTAGYLSSFDHMKFWDWVHRQTEPVFVSEYQAPEGTAVAMALNNKKRLSPKGMITDSVEKVFCNKAAIDIIRKKSA